MEDEGSINSTKKFNQKLYYCANAIDSEEFKQYTNKASVYVDYRRKTFS